MTYSLGVDLGTTYSAAATMRGPRPEIFQLGRQAATIPSVVVLRADGEVLTGEAADRRALAELFHDEDFHHIFRRKEIYNQLLGAAERLNICNSTLLDIVVKLC